MIRYIRQLSLNRSIRRYVYELGPALARRYGTLESYTVPQIVKTVKALRLDSRHAAYAVALFRSKASENTLTFFKMNQSELSELRRRIANGLFDGNRGYDALDTLKLSRGRGWRGGPSPNWLANKHGMTSL